uniref:Uncharacterized protein n=1 Tax=Anguilla anguilla TaxID=7936 RepID=A0A0E9VJV3_ANGAN
MHQCCSAWTCLSYLTHSVETPTAA